MEKITFEQYKTIESTLGERISEISNMIGEPWEHPASNMVWSQEIWAIKNCLEMIRKTCVE